MGASRDFPSPGLKALKEQPEELPAATPHSERGQRVARRDRSQALLGFGNNRQERRAQVLIPMGPVGKIRLRPLAQVPLVLVAGQRPLGIGDAGRCQDDEVGVI